MINMKDITSAVETLLTDGLTDYKQIARNVERNVDPSTAYGGWCGIYKGRISYDAYLLTGARGSSYRASLVEIVVEVQNANMTSDSDAEDAVETSIQDVLNILVVNPTLSNQIGITLGYDIDYEINTDKKPYIYSGLITIRTENSKN